MTNKYMVSATAVEEMLKNLLPERGMWEIEGDEAKNAICETVCDALNGLWKLPIQQPERKMGKWMLDDEYIDCSACKHEKWSRVPFESLVKQFNFCPNCGAYMRGYEYDG